MRNKPGKTEGLSRPRSVTKVLDFPGVLALLASSAAGQAWSFRDPGLWSSGLSAPPPMFRATPL